MTTQLTNPEEWYWPGTPWYIALSVLMVAGYQIITGAAVPLGFYLLLVTMGLLGHLAAHALGRVSEHD